MRIFTGRLLQGVVNHDVFRLLQVKRQLSDVLSRQAVGAVDGAAAEVRPKHFLLFKKNKKRLI